MAVIAGRSRQAALLAIALVLAVALGPRAQAAGHDKGKRPPGQFDFYVLSLSSVPGFCATSRKTPGECRKGLTFALHGLWPQLNGGDYPSNCSNVALTQADVQAAQNVYADPSLIPHEWGKHGTCSGLQPGAYFALSAAMTQHVRIPAAYGPTTVLKSKNAAGVVAAFVAANPGLQASDVSITGTKGVLTELDVCMSKAGAFRAC